MAQDPGKGKASPGENGKLKTPTTGHLYGKIIDSKTKEAVPFASVAIFKNDSVISGVFTKPNGDFSLENLPYGKFDLRITFIGFETFQQTITISTPNDERDLGDIKLKLKESQLKTVEITEEKSTIEMGIDRKVFNVDKNISSRGGTATDVMRNIPSVTIDANGNAQLRQNNVTIYIDGRPTNLLLDQIAADQIEKVELITNPSAKFEASTSGGIINIVMKSNSKPGYNGTATGGYGSHDHYNGSASLNIKQKPIGFSINYTFNTFKNLVPGYTNRRYLPSGYFNTINDMQFHHFFQSGTAALDYSINNRNTLTLSENIMEGDFNTYDSKSFEAGSSGNLVTTSGSRTMNSYQHFDNSTSKLFYKKTFPQKGKILTADINYNIGNLTIPTDYTTKTYDSNGILFPDNPEQLKNNVVSKTIGYSFQTDYISPINDSSKIEAGIRSSYRPSSQSMDMSQFDYATRDYVINSTLTNYSNTIDIINAVYLNYSKKLTSFNYLAGLRFEDSYYKSISENKNDSLILYHYPFGPQGLTTGSASPLKSLANSLFPGVFISKKIKDNQEIQFNISRKINRPNYRPFIIANDAKNYSMGNPAQTPESITLAELNFNQILSKGNILLTVFFRNIQDPLIKSASTLPSDPSIIVIKTTNGNQSNSAGMDNTFRYSLLKGLEATMNMNLFYTTIDASFYNNTIRNHGINYTGKLNIVYRLPKNLTMQFSANYESKKTIPQGYIQEVYFADFALSKEVYKFLTFTLSIRDVFDSNSNGFYWATDQFIQDAWGRRESRFVKLIISARFGTTDVKRKSKGIDVEGNDF